MARADTASASIRSDSIKGLAQSIAKPAYRRLLTAEPALRRAVPALIIAFLLTICAGAFVQIIDHRRQTVIEIFKESEAGAGVPAETIGRARAAVHGCSRRLALGHRAHDDTFGHHRIRGADSGLRLSLAGRARPGSRPDP